MPGQCAGTLQHTPSQSSTPGWPCEALIGNPAQQLLARPMDCISLVPLAVSAEYAM